MDNKRTFFATLIAPFASLIVLVGMILESIFNGQGLLFFDSFFVVYMFIAGFLSQSMLFLLVYGLPIHFLLSKLKVSYYTLYLLLGSLGPICFKILEHLGTETPISHRYTEIMVFGFSGFAVTTAFWFIAVYPHNKTMKTDMAEERRPAAY
ncbi:hypothetical protein [Glaciecola sp. KUL10]|uniref:hypothetical protein n=1 Tax=Glaciecola sp. (strain KUL10) TaxID=2161813 RepID=UPI000D78727D|nr:hypothetical protein [Glaciecola sp. KUL10]